MRRTSTRGLADLDDSTRGFVLAICVEDSDIEELGNIEELGDLDESGLMAREGCSGLFSTAVWTRGRLAHDEQCTGALHELSVRLDLRYIENVWFVREQCICELRRGLKSYVSRGEEAGFAGLLWALATDGRAQVRHLAHVLAQETFLRKCRELTGS
jgi:hypothetical protein